MPLWRRTKRGFAVFKGIEPNLFFDTFVNFIGGSNVRDAWIFCGGYDRREFAALHFA
jgi:hypothetical protein